MPSACDATLHTCVSVCMCMSLIYSPLSVSYGCNTVILYGQVDMYEASLYCTAIEILGPLPPLQA